MATVIVRTDTLLHIYARVGPDDNTGFFSKYTDQQHPGTNNKIEGFRWNDRTWPSEVEAIQNFYIPTLYDPTLFSAVDEDWQSGIGAREDLELLKINKENKEDTEKWLPEVKHGFFYLNKDEYYLFSDGLNSIPMSGLYDVGGFQYMQLPELPKPAVPVRVYKYIYNADEGKHEIDTNFELKYDFTPKVQSGVFLEIRDDLEALIHANVNTAEPEFILDYEDDTNPPLVILNGDYIDHQSEDVTLSGVTGAVELLGESTGEAGQLFYTKYSPLFSGANIEIYSYSSTASPVLWTTLSGINPQFSAPDAAECIVDFDMGSILFGDYDPADATTSGLIPTAGDKIAAKYESTVFVDYEIDNTTDYHVADKADMNPLHRAVANGFVHVRNAESNPASLQLIANLPEISQDYYGPIYLGFTYGELIATVLDEFGAPMDGQTVQFDIYGNVIGSFGLGQTSTEAVSDAHGRASAFYIPPASITNLGYATDDVTFSGGNSILTFDDVLNPTSTDKFYLFEVMREDVILGIPEDQVTSYYEDYLADEMIVPSGVEVGWEGTYRVNADLPVPQTYTTAELSKGAKKAVLAWDTSALHPMSGVLGAWSMPVPASYETVGDTTSLIYDITLSGISPSSEHKAFFVATTSQVQFRASAYNPVLKRRIYSNVVTIALDIPDQMSGLYAVDAFNTLPSGLLMRPKTDGEFNTFFDTNVYDGSWLDSELEALYYIEMEDGETPSEWFTRTRRQDSELLTLEQVTSAETVGGIIPLGFRVRSSGKTMASTVDGVTFVTKNS